MGPEQERANDRLWEVAALITVLGAAIYGLGLLGVAWPIYKRWHNDAATTLYAISLIPRAVVAGQGMRIFMGFPTLIATLLLIWWFVVFPLLRLVDVVASALAAWVVGIFALLALLAGGYWLLRSMYRRGIQWVLGPAPEHPRYRWLIWITTGLAVPTFFVAGRLAAGAMNFHASFPYVTIDTNLLIVAIALSFLASSLLQLVDATAIEPPLPTVEITLSDGTQTVLEGKLLIHIEGVCTSLMKSAGSPLCPMAWSPPYGFAKRNHETLARASTTTVRRTPSPLRRRGCNR